ncbi:unnamed protein product, partial [Rotaria magnacalcarata]
MFNSIFYFRSVLLQKASELEFYGYSWNIYVWLKNIHQLDWSWIQACEQAAYEYKLLLNEHLKSPSMINEKKEDKISDGLVKFLTRKVYDCYSSLHQWRELKCKWH